MKRISHYIFTLALCFYGVLAHAQDSPRKENLYDPSEDAKTEIAKAVKKAEVEGKHVFLQIGGNWCGWCRLFDERINSDGTLRTFMENNFIVYHVNYSPENRNVDVLASLGFPQRFGFPVFVILDSKGNRIHTQNSVYLEEGKGHSSSKILEFLKHWSPAALDPENYEHQ